VSILTRKNGSRPTVATVAQRARDTATQAVPVAKNAGATARQSAEDAVVIAKNAGATARQSAEDAVAWATPRVMDARAWAAPYVEQAGVAVRDKIAPAISDALVDAAHRLDVSEPKRRVWPRVLAGIAMLAAAGSAVAAAVLRRRPTGMEFGSTGATSEHGATAQGAAGEMAAGESGEADDKEGKTNGPVSSS
jgi:hypothetical protein